MIKKLYQSLWKTIDKITQKKRIFSPDENVISCLDLPYGTDIENQKFDIFLNKSTDKPLPTIFMFHGGGYLAGHTNATRSFCQQLARHGFTVFNIDYTKSDAKRQKYFPTPIYEFYKFYNVISAHEGFQKIIDFDNIFMAGDSAGAHIAALISNLQTNDILKTEYGVVGGPRVKGSILICPSFGIYNFNGHFPQKPYHELIFGKFDQRDPICDYTHVLDVTTETYPPSIMLSVKNDFVVGTHKKQFIELAKELDLSLEHYDICSGYKLFHCSMFGHIDKYPGSINKIANFVNNAKRGIYPEGITLGEIYEDESERV